LGGDPIGGEVAAALTGSTALQRIIRQVFHGGPDLFGIDGVRSGRSGIGDSGLAVCGESRGQSEEEVGKKWFHRNSVFGVLYLVLGTWSWHLVLSRLPRSLSTPLADFWLLMANCSVRAPRTSFSTLNRA